MNRKTNQSYSQKNLFKNDSQYLVLSTRSQYNLLEVISTYTFNERRSQSKKWFYVYLFLFKCFMDLPKQRNRFSSFMQREDRIQVILKKYIHHQLNRIEIFYQNRCLIGSAYIGSIYIFNILYCTSNIIVHHQYYCTSNSIKHQYY